MSRNDRLWIMVDLETSGPVYGRHSMVELGAWVGSQDTGPQRGFEVLIKPVSDAVKTSRERFEQARVSGLDPTEAMERFEAWTRPYIDQGATFIARPAAFDWPWIVYYAWTWLDRNPFGFKAVCASSWFEARGRRFDVKLPHRAGEDARIQLAHFFQHM